MKKLLFIFILAPLFGLSQITFTKNTAPITEVYSTRTDLIVQQWKQYLNDCNTLVPDTIVVKGVIHTQYKATMVFGKMQYLIIPKDTVWDKFTKSKYKYEEARLYFSGATSYRTINKEWLSANDVGLYNGVYVNKNNPAPNIQINKTVIYQIPKQKATWSDFWERWLVENNIIEGN